MFILHTLFYYYPYLSCVYTLSEAVMLSLVFTVHVTQAIYAERL
jgi:hypothetical protein